MAEAIDLAAKKLATKLAAANDDDAAAADLAETISDLAVGLFEACNFQDLAGQRVNKVLAALQAAGSTDAAQDGRRLHGPRLDGDAGHVSQRDVDALFGD